MAMGSAPGWRWAVPWRSGTARSPGPGCRRPAGGRAPGPRPIGSRAPDASAHVSVLPDGHRARLRPVGQSVRVGTHRDGGDDLARRRVDDRYRAVVAIRDPQLRAVRVEDQLVG